MPPARLGEEFAPGGFWFPPGCWRGLAESCACSFTTAPIRRCSHWDPQSPGTPTLGTGTPGASPGARGTPGCSAWAFPSCHPKETPRPGFDLLAKEHKRGRAPTSPPVSDPGTGLPGAGTRPRACTRVRVAPAVPLRLPHGSGQEEPVAVDSNEGSQRAGWGWGEANAQGAARTCPKRPHCRHRAPAAPKPAPFPHGRCPHGGPAPPRDPVLLGLSTLRVLRVQPSSPPGCAGCRALVITPGRCRL